MSANEKAYMYILKAHGGRWEDSWQTCLFAVKNVDSAHDLLEAFRATKDAYVVADKIFQEKKEQFINKWRAENPQPVVVKLQRSPKPKHPEPDVSLRGLSKKDKKNLPLQKLYLKQLKDFSINIANWQQEEREMFKQEYAETDAWQESCAKAISAFTEENLKPLNLFPEKWKEKVSRYISYAYSVDSEDHFSIEVLEVLE